MRLLLLCDVDVGGAGGDVSVSVVDADVGGVAVAAAVVMFVVLFGVAVAAAAGGGGDVAAAFFVAPYPNSQRLRERPGKYG